MAANLSVNQNTAISSSPSNAESPSGANDEGFFDVCEPATAVRPFDRTPLDRARFHCHVHTILHTLFRADQGHTDILEFENEKTPEGTLARSTS